jgi:hypothetical protein
MSTGNPLFKTVVVMAPPLTIKQKNQLWGHKAAVEKDRQKVPFRDQLAYCKANFKSTNPSSSQLSRVLTDRETWKGEKGARVKGGAWPDLEKALVKMVIGRLNARKQSTLPGF